MLMPKEREDIVKYLQKMITAGLTKGTSGNISIIDRENNHVAISPSGMDYFEIKPEDIVIIDMEGNTIEGNKKASSEYGLHLAIYKEKLDTNSIVHTHSMYCTILSCLNIPVKPIHYVLANACLGDVPIASYEIYGSKALAQSVIDTIGDSNVCLMANHGMIACGKSIKNAFGLASNCEWVAELQWKSMCIGEPNYLSENQIKDVRNKFKTYGQIKSEDNNKNNEGNGYF